MHIAQRLQYWARSQPDKAALVSKGVALSWRDLDRRARGVAAQYRALGVKPGDRVGCLYENSVDWCVAFAAAIYVDAIFVPLNPMFGELEARQIREDAAFNVLVSSAAHVGKVGVAPDAACDGAAKLFVLNAPDVRPVPLAGASDASDVSVIDNPTFPLTICYTSGTSGMPKGVVLAHSVVETAMYGLAAGYGWTSQDRMLVTAPLSFAGGYICSLAPAFFFGFTAYIERVFHPGRVLQLMESEGITCFGGVPTLWQRIADEADFDAADLSRLGKTFTGGAPVPVPLLELYAAKGVVIRQSYGCTESCGGATLCAPEDALVRPHACGIAMMGLEMEIRNEAAVVARGDIGEICLRGPQMMLGYWQKDGSIHAPFESGWFHTGDLGFIDEHGGLVVVDRKKNMVITGGVNVYPAQVERAMEKLPSVAEVVVFGLPNADWGEELVAIVRKAEPISSSDLKAATRHLLGPYKTPKRIRFSEKPLARTTTGKIARANLAAAFAALAGE